MNTTLVKKYCRLDSESANLLNQAITSLGLSARAYHRILKIARTIADLAGDASPTMSHVAEAVQYRRVQYDL
jgi:magnesium chelatase family protein